MDQPETSSYPRSWLSCESCNYLIISWEAQSQWNEESTIPALWLLENGKIEVFSNYVNVLKTWICVDVKLVAMLYSPSGTEVVRSNQANKYNWDMKIE